MTDTREQVERFAYTLERSSGIQGVWIEYDNCADMARALRALGETQP